MSSEVEVEVEVEVEETVQSSELRAQSTGEDGVR
jgi:hypothetical protein